MSWRGRLSQSVQELRFTFTNGGEASKGISSFISNNYYELKTLNPRLPFLIRDCGMEDEYPPMIHARFDYGREQSVTVAGFTEDQVEKVLQNFVEISENMPRSDESVPHDEDVIFMYSVDPNKYQWGGSFSAIQ